MKYVLAIDQSTSATKAVLFDDAGRLVDRVSREHRQIYPQPGWVEHDAEEIWQNVVGVLADIARRNANVETNAASVLDAYADMLKSFGGSQEAQAMRAEARRMRAAAALTIRVR